MTLEEIQQHWEADSKFDRERLDEESLRISHLHQKYFRMLSTERLQLKRLEAEHRRLRLEKHEFLTQGPHADTPKDWRRPAIGRIIKSEVHTYMDGDKELNESQLKIDYQTEKVELLRSIIENLSRRGFSVKNAIDWIKFTNGA